MARAQALLVVIEPRVIELVSSYVLEPRKREVAALNLAEQLCGGTLDVPRTVERAAGISARLDRVVRAYEQASRSQLSSDAIGYGRAVFRELAWLGSSIGTTFHQGVGRSLGMLAHPRQVAGLRLASDVAHLVRALRYLVTPSAGLAPRLARPGWDLEQPAWGGPGLASGCIPLDYMSWLGGLLSGSPYPLQALTERCFGVRDGAEWRVTALAAVAEASRRRAHLLEVDLEVLRASRSTPPPRPEAPLHSDIHELLSGTGDVNAA